MKGIEGRIHVITGGYGGIAMATARLLAVQGGRVVLTGRDVNRGRQAASELAEETGAQVVFYPMDVADAKSVSAAAVLIEQEVGPVYGLVLNAAYVHFNPSTAHSDHEWRNVMAVNLDGAFFCAKSFGRVMHGRGGAIVIVSSIAARTSVGPHLAYSASKAGLSHMATVLAIEWAQGGIRVNVVEPGYTATSAIEHLKTDAPEVASKIEAEIPLGRFLVPDEIANPICFLLSDLSSGMTGSVVVADGGLSAR